MDNRHKRGVVTGLVTLRNDFHGTETAIRVPPGTLKCDQIRRAKLRLCSVKDCLCGGIRGPQTHNGHRFEIATFGYDYQLVYR